MIVYQLLTRLWGNGRMSAADAPFFSHLKTLGVSHVWYSGIARHSTGQSFVKGDPGSPYAIHDHYDVNPYLADDPDRRMEEFEALVRRTHEAGLKVVVDFIPNHVGRDYIGNVPHFDYGDYDWTDTLKIDYIDTRSWDEMTEVLRFWASKGVDGFRCDMVELVPKPFLRYAISNVKEQYPDVIFIAEAYNKDSYGEYTGLGFDYLYDKSGLYDVLLAMHENRGTAKAISWNWQFLGDLQPKMLNFLENHDEIRFNNWAALHVSMLLNTAPFMIYFGEEVGEDASIEGNRRTSIFEWRHYPAIDRLYANIHGEGELTETEVEYLQRYREIALIASEPAFQTGKTFDLCYANGPDQGFNQDKQFAFLRSDGEDTYLIVSNFDDCKVEMNINIPEHASDYLGVNLKAVENGVSVVVAARDAVIIKIF